MDDTRRVRIVATLGPASAAPEVIARLIDAGVDVFRLNFSHGDHAWQRQSFARVRTAAHAAGKQVAILTDLQGPKIRFGPFPAGAIYLERGQAFAISTVPPEDGTAERGFCSYRHLPRDLEPGDQILANDGLLSFRVESIHGDEVHTRVEVGGPLSSHKGINLPGVKLTTPAVTEKDRHDLDLAIELGADLVAVSFVRAAHDLDPVQSRLREGGSRAWVVAKIEKPEAVADYPAILARADGIMIARGDLGVEVPPERVPSLQKDLIAEANRAGKPVITATQMLESMTHNPRPTRAEVSDVAGAVADGTDAVMLSGETAAGKYPVEAVEMMDRIVREAERDLGRRGGAAVLDPTALGDTGAAIASAVVRADQALALDGIVVFTMSGYTARLVSNARPAAPIIALTRYPDTARRVGLLWGIRPEVVEHIDDFDTLTRRAREIAARRLASRGGRIALLAGVPLGERRPTNLLCLLET